MKTFFVLIYFLSFLISASGAWLVIKHGEKLGLIDRPNHRSSHKNYIPKSGGIGILISFCFSCLLLGIPMGFWWSAVLVALISLWGGDKHKLTAGQRLVLQFLCSLLFIVAVGSLDNLNLPVFLFLPLAVFIVGTSNFYNFMDGIDGIAGISGIVAFTLLWSHNFFYSTNDIYGALCIVMIVSCLGFLVFNLPEAKVFLGDVGSVFIGFVFSCMVIFKSQSLIDFLVMIGFLVPFYFDELITMVIRIRNGDSLLVAHRKHIYQLLANELSISHWKISLMYGLLQLLIGFSMIALIPMGIRVVLMTYCIYAISFGFITIKIHKKVSCI